MYDLQEIPRRFSPIPIWWWSGGTVTKEIITCEMEKWCGQGVYNLMIMNVAPASSMFGKDADDPLYMTEEWWELFLFTCETAKRLGMYIYFYDQLGFSGANFPNRVIEEYPEYMGETLKQTVEIVKQPAELTFFGTLLAAFMAPADENGEQTGPFTQIPVQGNAVKVSDPNQIVQMVGYIKEGMDFLSPAACRELIRRIHGQFEEKCREYLGTVIVGSFQDELGAINTWSDGFAEAFQREKGYDLIPVLHLLFWDDGSTEGKRVRRDYQDVRARLAETAFFRPCFEWHEKFGIGCGTDQTNLTRAGNTLDTVVYYGDYMRNERWYDMPGCDLMGNSHIHASIANANHRSRVWFEAFHSTGWGGTLEETFDWIIPWYTNGANLYDPHGGYSTMKGAYFEWAPPTNGIQQAGFKDYKPFADVITRMSFLMSQGTHVSDVAVIYPNSAAQAAYLLDSYTTIIMDDPQGDRKTGDSQKIQECYEAVTGRMNWFEDPVSGEGILGRGGVDFEILGEILFEEEQVTAAEGRLKTAGLSFDTVILPECQTLTGKTVTALNRFINTGGQVIAIGALPVCLDEEYREEFENFNVSFEETSSEKKAVFLTNAEELLPLLQKRKKKIVSPVPTLYRKDGGINILYVPAIHVQATENCIATPMTPDKNKYDFNPERYAKNMEILLRDVEEDIFEMNLETGEAVPAIFSRNGEYTKVILPFERFPVTILLWEDGKKGVAEPGRLKHEQIVGKLECIWEYMITPTLDNSFGDFELPAYPGSPKLQTWYVNQVKGDEIVLTKTTFGPQAWYTVLSAGSSLTALSEKSIVWKPVVYSKTRGIEKDPVHAMTLGACGHIPDEFIDCGMVNRGETAVIRTGVYSETELSADLILGAPGAKRQVYWNGREAFTADAGYQTFHPVSVKKGMNTLEIRLSPKEDETWLRVFWSMTDQKGEVRECFRKPLFLTVKEAQIRDTIPVKTSVMLDELPVKTRISFGASYAVYDLRINGRLYKGSDSFANYKINGTGVTLLSDADWVIGENEIILEMTPVIPVREASAEAIPPFCILDGYLEFENGDRKILKTGAGWTVNGKEPCYKDIAGLGMGGITCMNIDSLLVNAYPKSLPGFEWLETKKPPAKALDMLSDADFGQKEETVFTWKIPSAASRVYLDLGGRGTLTVDGIFCPIENGMAELPETKKETMDAVLRIIPDVGYKDGSIFRKPVSYDTDRTGVMLTGDWQEKGLESWSGGVTYKKTVKLPETEGELWIDFGKIRGTAECFADGESAGKRFLTPYRFNLTSFKGKTVRLELMVTNTLAPYMKAVSPTVYIPEVQLVSGLFGPVKLIKFTEKEQKE